MELVTIYSDIYLTNIFSEFDEFIELIARRQNQSTEPLEEIYAPPVYEEANSKPNKPWNIFHRSTFIIYRLFC